MRIGYDISQTGRFKTGCGFYADGLLGALAAIDNENEYILYPTFGDSFWDPDGPTITGVSASIGDNFQGGLRQNTPEEAWRFWSNPPIDFEAQLGAPDLIHSNNFFTPHGLTHAKLVYTLYDLTFLEHPSHTTVQNWSVCFGGIFEASLRADLIIAISNATRAHFLKVFPHFPSDRIIVVYPGSRFADRPAAPRPPQFDRLRPGQFWLNVGTLEPRKNQRALLRACARLKGAQQTCMPLVLAGRNGWLLEDMSSYVGELGLTHDTMILGYVDDDALSWLYRNCFALIYPSIGEGFGLPVLEAMGFGVPVISSDIAPHREIVGDGGLFVDPASDESICFGLGRLISDAGLQASLRAQAARCSSRFSWQASALTVREAYKAVLNGRCAAHGGTELQCEDRHDG